MAEPSAESEDKGIRLARWMALAGLCSRREAERWVAAGLVSLNGKVLSTPAVLLHPGDVVQLDGHPVAPPSARPRLWRYFKPQGVITTHQDPGGRPTVFAQLPPEMPRVVSAGRLDINSEGLLLLTNHGPLARALEHPDSGLARTYRVRVYGALKSHHLKQLAGGMVVAGQHYRPVHAVPDKAVSAPSEGGRNQWLTLTLHEGKNREIRVLMEALGLQVSRLIRTGYGSLTAGSLKPGEVAEVLPLPQDIEALLSTSPQKTRGLS